jgi:SAM-dependent methyltransferase
VTVPPPPDAAYFDQWYSSLAVSPAHSEIARRTLGLPAELESTSLLSWDGIGDVVAALELRTGDTLVDLACGRGGYGLEVARRTGARLIGIDFSAVAVGIARDRAGADGAEFRVGDLTATGLPDASVDAIMCVDAMQFAEPYRAGPAECRRILKPGGRLVLTGWQADDLDDETIPARLRQDIAAELRAAGFTDVDVRHMATWRAAERAHWAAATALDPGDDPALQSLHREAQQVRPWLDRSRRVLAQGRAPAAS